jgi:ubiquinone/menaquinone biosynthesis C-methylase UbiE
MADKKSASKIVVTRDYYNSEYFQTHPDYFDASESRFQRYRIKKVMDIYTPRKTEKIIDLGVGWGTFSFYTSSICEQVTGIDYSFYSVSLCQQRSNELGIQNTRFLCADVQAIPLSDASYDVIICADLVEHLYPAQFTSCLKECKRLLRSRGKLVIWAPNQQHWLEQLRKNHFILQPYIGHVDYKSMERVTEALKELGFAIQRSYFTESHLPLIKLIEKLLLPYFSLMRRRIAILAEKID